MGRLTGSVGRGTLFRLGFVAAAGSLAIAAAAWACVAHSDPTNNVDLSITDPTDPVPSSHVRLVRNKDYVWTATGTGLTNGDNYEIRVAKHSGHPEPMGVNHSLGDNFCGGAIGTDEYRMVGPTAASGNQISGTNKIPSTATANSTTGTVYDACVVDTDPTQNKIETFEVVVF